MFEVLVQAARLEEREFRGEHSNGDGSIAAEWRGSALSDEATFSAYLASRRLEVGQLAGILAGESWAPRVGTMDWSVGVESLLIAPAEAGTMPRIPPIVIESTRLDSIPFDGLFEDVFTMQSSFLDDWSWLREGPRGDLLCGLATEVLSLSIRCLIEELSRVRDVPGTDERGLVFSSSYELMNSQLKEPGYRREFYGRYPVLARDLVHVVGSWRAHVAKLLDRLVADEADVRSAGLVVAPARTLRGVRLFAGDKHSGREGVALLEFENGDRLAYKPRDCEVFRLYKGLTTMFNEGLSAQARLRAPGAVVKDGYGWVEYMSSGEETIPHTEHLRKIGSLLGLAHVLGASDLHFENVVAAQDGPVPIDLETIVQNRSRRPSTGYALDLAGIVLNTSVLGTGILPMRLKNGQDDSLDVSVLTGGLSGSGTTVEVHCIADPCTDNMRIVSRSLPVGRSLNQPAGMTTEFIRENRSEVIAGYRELCGAAIRNRLELKRVLRAMGDVHCREVVRPTRSYSLLLAEMRQPYRVRSGLHREHLLRSIWANRSAARHENLLAQEEEQALAVLEVPLFTTSAHGRDLLVEGRVVVQDYFDTTLYDDLVRRIDALDESRLDESVGLIDESVCAAVPEISRGTPLSTEDVDVVVTRSSSARGIDEVGRGFADELLQAAIRGRDDVTWIGMVSSEDNKGLEYRPVGPTLYDGLAGIGFASLCAHQVFPGLGFDDLAARSMRAVSAVLEDWCLGKVDLPLGAYSGAAGLIYALRHFDESLGGGEYAGICSGAVDQIVTAVDADPYLDISSGAAGACAVLAACFDSEASRGALTVVAQHLIDSSVVLNDGSRAWGFGDAKVRLGGFSHGATGIGWALALAARRLGAPAFERAALQALAFDDSLYDDSRRGWLDMRPESLEAGELYPHQWCHGGAGIAMARRHAASILGVDGLLDLAAIGRDESLIRDVPNDDSLCHGSLGNWLTTSGWTDSGSTALRGELKSRLLARIAGRGFLNGLPSGIRSVPGLMLGTAGALYASCVAEMQSLPNVLLLEGPGRFALKSPSPSQGGA